MEELSKRVENTAEKGEIARYEQFLLFPQCFQKACFPGVSKGVIVWEWVKLHKTDCSLNLNLLFDENNGLLAVSLTSMIFMKYFLLKPSNSGLCVEGLFTYPLSHNPNF